MSQSATQSVEISARYNDDLNLCRTSTSLLLVAEKWLKTIIFTQNCTHHSALVHYGTQKNVGKAY